MKREREELNSYKSKYIKLRSNLKMKLNDVESENDINNKNKNKNNKLSNS